MAWTQLSVNVERPLYPALTAALGGEVPPKRGESSPGEFFYTIGRKRQFEGHAENGACPSLGCRTVRQLLGERLPSRSRAVAVGVKRGKQSMNAMHGAT